MPLRILAPTIAQSRDLRHCKKEKKKVKNTVYTLSLDNASVCRVGEQSTTFKIFTSHIRIYAVYVCTSRHRIAIKYEFEMFEFFSFCPYCSYSARLLIAKVKLQFTWICHMVRKIFKYRIDSYELIKIFNNDVNFQNWFWMKWRVILRLF